MATPLYKKLKENGTSFYCFPSSANDISKAFMNTKYKVYFSKFVLLNIPKQVLSAGSENNKIVFDFDNAFFKSNNAMPASNFSEQIVESLRNYVANYETTMKMSRLNDTEYYYDLNVLTNPSEKIFWRWAKKLNLIDYEVASNSEYYNNLPEFDRKNLNFDDYLPEFLWTERKSTEYDMLFISESTQSGYVNKLEVEFNGMTNFKKGDYINIYDTNNLTAQNNVIVLDEYLNSNNNHRVILDYTFVGGEQSETGKAKLNYHKLVQYVGEINGVSNIALNTKSYAQVYAHISAHAGATPSILFRTKYDNNYKPNSSYPILPSQYQPEIIGAENFSNPLVANPSAYGGSYYGQFDTDDFTYETEMGDSERRNGDYFGSFGNYFDIKHDSSNLDGLSIDFNIAHYTKMNQTGSEMRNFDEFNTSTVDREYPEDFEFNAILWYYRIESEDDPNISYENLYGIEFLDNPDNNPIPSETGIRFPVLQKRAQKENSDGLSYAFTLNLQYQFLTDNPQELYNPQSINSVFNFTLYQEALAEFAGVSDMIDLTNNNSISIRKQIQDLRQLLYSQADIQTLNRRITQLGELMQVYSTLQIQDSDTIKVSRGTNGTFDYISLENVAPDYNNVVNINTSNLYTGNSYNPLDLAVYSGKKTLYNIINNDTTSVILSNNDNLSIILSKDLDYLQTIEFNIDANTTATENKKLDIYIKSLDSNNILSTQLLFSDIDLPIYLNKASNSLNYAARNTVVNLPIDVSAPVTVQSNGYVEFKIDMNENLLNNMVKQGDTFILRNLDIITNFTTNEIMKFDGQYTIDTVDVNTGRVTFILDSNVSFMEYLTTQTTFPYDLNGSVYSLANVPTIDINKGFKILITRIDDTNLGTITERYKMEIVRY